MTEHSFDPGLTQQYDGTLRRIINKDGSFNVKRRGARLRDLNLYLFLVSVPWSAFFGIVVASYVVSNLIFGTIFYLIGVEQLTGADHSTPGRAFLSAFFFSAHTLTTVGYGNIAPNTITTNALAAGEALFGLLQIAVATGLLVGRVSRPSARIAFSNMALIAPYEGQTALEFRVANARSNTIMELEAKVMLMTVDPTPEGLRRDYKVLRLERPSVYFFPLTWTVVHAIDHRSPLHGKTAADLERLQAEILILLKGYDETFAQTVLERYSYRYDEIVWGASFAPAFHVDQHGGMVVDIDRISDIKKPAQAQVS